jgi:N-acetyl-anhydromuramyl-L-alanine amidase AmpD
LRAPPTVARGALVGLVALLSIHAGCDDTPELALGPPRCEPARELDHERNLKAGFRALYEGDVERARASFTAVEAEEPGHPEAALGLRLVAARATHTTNDTKQVGKTRILVPPSTAGHSAGTRREVLVAGERHEVPVEVVTDTLRFEGFAELDRARGKARELFSPRTRAGADIDPTKAEDVRAVVELIVLHDTNTLTRVERVAALVEANASVHFVIDWDGRVFQTLDLAFAARHTLDSGVDGRSIGIELLNPVDLDKSGALPDGSTRPKSDKVSVQGVELAQWGYTEAQLASLERLVDGLLVVFPQIARRVPAGPAGVVPRAVISAGQGDVTSGVLGHLHLSKDASDPGAAFPWDRLAKHLAR